MPPRKSQKVAEKAKLAQPASFTITIASTEANLQRIAALLLFADRDKVVLNYDDCPMPFDDPNDPKFTGPKPEIDYNAVRHEIVGLLQKFVAANRTDVARELLAGRTLRDIPESELLTLWSGMEASLKLVTGADA
jgi:hypothetical protein